MFRYTLQLRVLIQCLAFKIITWSFLGVWVEKKKNKPSWCCRYVQNWKHELYFWWGAREDAQSWSYWSATKVSVRLCASVTVSTQGLRNIILMSRLEIRKVTCNFSIFRWSLRCTSHCTWVCRHAKLVLVARRTNSSCVKSLKLRLINEGTQIQIW